jgi:hypothetical protein
LAGVPVPGGLDGISIAPLLLQNGPLPVRRFFWHFPHYNNQGGRPAGALRDGDWKFVTYYDTGEVQLFNLKNDIGETNDVAETESRRASDLQKAHQLWLNEINAQRNTPNPEFDPSLFKKLYVDFDPSRPILRNTASQMEKDMADWRKLMNEVVANQRAAQKAKKGKK